MGTVGLRTRRAKVPHQAYWIYTVLATVAGDSCHTHKALVEQYVKPPFNPENFCQLSININLL